MNERSPDPLPQGPAKTAAPTNLGSGTVQPVSPARSSPSDPYAAAGREITDILRNAYEAAERTLATAQLDASAIRVAAEADWAIAEQARAQAIAELVRARELRAALDAERRRLRAQTEAMADTQSRNADRDRGIEVLLLASLEVLRTGDTDRAPLYRRDEVIDLRDATLLEPGATGDTRPDGVLSGTTSEHGDPGEKGRSQPSDALPTTAKSDDEIALAVRAAVSRVVDSWDVPAAPSGSN